MLKCCGGRAAELREVHPTLWSFTSPVLAASSRGVLAGTAVHAAPNAMLQPGDALQTLPFPCAHELLHHWRMHSNSPVVRRPRWQHSSQDHPLSATFARPPPMVLRTARPRRIGDTAADEAANTWCDRRNGLLLRGGGDSPATPTPHVALHDRHAAPGPLFQLAKASGAAQPLGRLESGAGVEYLSCVKVKPDGRCLFRSLVLGLAANKGTVLSSQQEEKEADLLRSACAEALCPSLESRAKYPEAVLSIKAEMTIQEYCKRVVLPTFWGGESELLVLTQLLRQPVTIYLPADGGRSLGYTPLVSYGTQFATTKSGQPRKKVKLLYSNGNHYDLLL